MDDPDRRYFYLTPAHVALLRSANVTWNGAEWGAPGVDPKRPYGDGDLLRSIHLALNPDSEWDGAFCLPKDMTPREWTALAATYRSIHRETETALQVVLASGSFEPGRYSCRSYYDDWVREEVVARG